MSGYVSEEELASIFKARMKTEAVGIVPTKPLYPPIRLLDRNMKWASDVEGIGSDPPVTD
jgi:hypothetical protein